MELFTFGTGDGLTDGETLFGVMDLHAVGDAPVGPETRAFEVVKGPGGGAAVTAGEFMGERFDGAVAGFAGAVVGRGVGRREQQLDAMVFEEGARVARDEGGAVVGLEHQRRPVCGEQGGENMDGSLRILSDESLRPTERLHRYFTAQAEKLASLDYKCGCLMGNLAAELSDHSKLISDRLSSIFAGWTRALATCIRDAQRAGEVRTDIEADALAAFLLRLNPRNASALQNAPDFAAQGAAVYQASHCDMCHKVNAVGMMAGPPLNGLSKRRSRRWVEMHFADPQKLVPGSAMPPYRLPSQDMENLTSYLFSLPEQ